MRPSASAISRSADAFGEDDDIACLGRVAQAIDQLLPGAAGQAMHAQRGMPRIIEIVDHVERQAIAIRQPFDQRPRTLRHRLDHDRIGLVVRLALDIGGEQLRAVGDALFALEARAGGGDEPGRQRGRAGRRGLAFDHHRIDARLFGGERGTQAGGAGADNQQRHLAVEFLIGRRDDAAHDAVISFMASAMVATLQTGRSPSIAARCTSRENAAQPSSSTVHSMSRTWASRTVEATPPLVTMPPTTSRSMPLLRSSPFQPRHVEGRIGDLLDRHVRRRKLIDELLAPGAGREIALASGKAAASSGAAK